MVCVLLMGTMVWAESLAAKQLLGKLPGSPAVMLDERDAATLGVSTPEGTTYRAMAVPPGDGVPFDSAVRVEVGRSYLPTYEAQVMSAAAQGPIRRGDTVLLSFWIRSPSAMGGASGIASYRLQLDGPPWTAPAGGSTSVGTQWKQVFAFGTAEEDFPDGRMRLAIHIGQQRQTLDFGGVVVVNLGQKVDLTTLPQNQITWPGMEPDAPWRKEAQRRIEAFRMGPLSVEVLDAAGKPVAGAVVSVVQKRRAFEVGSFMQSNYFTGTLGESADGAKAREVVQRLYNRATAPIYWADWGWPGQRDNYLAIARWLRDNGLTTRGHVMFYPGWKFMPAEVVKLQSDPEALRRRILGQIAEIGAATREFGFREYDVTNELRDLPEVHTLLGREAVVEWFAAARRAVPGAKMALNENSILTAGGATKANQDTYLEWYRFLKSNGQAPDVMGFQGHFGEDFTAPETVWAILDRFAAETDAELQITEFDINTLNEEAQAAYTRDFMIACFAHPRVTSFTMWGFWEGDHWLPRAALFRKDWSIKPNGKVLEELVTQEWATNESLTTGPDGVVSLRAFLGSVEVTVSHGGQALTNRVELRDPKEAAKLTIRLK
jgi:endo-1,4-beta-xylanase